MKIPLLGDIKQNTTEKISIVMIVLGLLLFSLGSLVSIFSQVGLSAILAMFGALITFVFTIVLIFYWLFKERSE